jgi:GTP-binding protein|tara:strand:- start:382 stop:987 length:606 start_codon:yes stop_codon:yes gene_type:complete
MNTTVTNFYSNDKVEDCPQLNIPEYAFIGRSNVGKSSLINLLLNQKVAYTSSKPGKTQLINHIIVENSWALVDLPGYGYAKLSKTERNKILKRNRTYFTNRGLPLVAVFMLIDIRIPPQKIDLQKMEWLVKNNVYFIRIFTKSDGIKKPKVTKSIHEYDKYMQNNNWGKMPETIVTSSKKNIGKTDILNRIKELNKLFQNI